jgi:rubredoxin
MNIKNVVNQEIYEHEGEKKIMAYHKPPKKCEICGADLFNRMPHARFCKVCANDRREAQTKQFHIEHQKA